MIFYSFYYLSIIFLLLFDYSFKKIKLFLYIALSIVVLISGTRYNTGYDFYNYHVFYTYGMNESLEPLFKFSVYILKLFSSDSQVMFFTYSLCTIMLIYFVITKMTKYVKTSFMIYLLIPGLYINSFSIIRFSLAESFFILAIYYLIYKNKQLKFWFYSLIAIGFHYTAIVPILLIYIFKRLLFIRYSIGTYLFYILLSLVLAKLKFANILISMAIGKFSVYLEMPEDVSILKIIVYNLFIITLIFFSKQYIKKQNDIFLLNVLFIGIIILNLFIEFVFVTRLSYYFLIFQIILVPKLIYSFRSNNMKLITFFLFFTYYILMFTNALEVDKYVNSDYRMTPYKNYFLQD